MSSDYWLGAALKIGFLRMGRLLVGGLNKASSWGRCGGGVVSTFGHPPVFAEVRFKRAVALQVSAFGSPSQAKLCVRQSLAKNYSGVRTIAGLCCVC